MDTNFPLPSVYRTQKCRKPLVRRLVVCVDSIHPRILCTGRLPGKDRSYIASYSKFSMMYIYSDDIDYTLRAYLAISHINAQSRYISREYRSIVKAVFGADWCMWMHAVGNPAHNWREYTGYLYLGSDGRPTTIIVGYGTRNRVSVIECRHGITIHSHPRAPLSRYPSTIDYSKSPEYSLLVTHLGVVIYRTHPRVFTYMSEADIARMSLHDLLQRTGRDFTCKYISWRHIIGRPNFYATLYTAIRHRHAR